MGVGVAVYDCKNCTIEVKGKFQGLSLTTCKNVKVIVDKVVSYVDISQCENTEVTPLTQLKTIKVERSTKLNVNLNEQTRGCQIISTHSKDIFIEGPRLVPIPPANEDDEPETTIKLPVADSYKIQLDDAKDDLTYEPIIGFE